MTAISKACHRSRVQSHVQSVRLRLPGEPYRLEEINMPADLAKQLAGQMVEVEVFPEEQAMTRKLPDGDYAALVADGSVLLAPDGTVWNDYHPARMIYRDKQGREWNLPRHWQPGHNSAEPAAESASQVFKECRFIETVHLPSRWDLEAVNIPPAEAGRAGGQAREVSVHLKPNQQTRVLWRDSCGDVWRIPHDWRRRRICLPGFDVLMAQGVPEGVARCFGGTVVSVNYHPGSLCCLENGYRFRDEHGRRWPVRKQDCFVLGFGSDGEGFA